MMLFIEDEGEHNWVFSADQLETGGTGLALVFCVFLIADCPDCCSGFLFLYSFIAALLL